MKIKFLTSNTIKEPYIVFNFDEKWIADKYIDTYEKIEPSLNEFIEFAEKISDKHKLVIVNGYNENHILNNFQTNNSDRIIIKNKIDIFEFKA